MNKKAIIHTDGGARGNPGPAGIGVVIEYGGEKKRYKEYIGETTNNQAEYRAGLLAMEKARELGLEDLAFFIDSELVVRQLNREYRVKDAGLAHLFVQIWNLSQGFAAVTYTHVRREQNTEADRLVNEALDEAAT